MQFLSWIILAVAVTGAQADVTAELLDGQPLDQVLSNALAAGMDLNEAVGAAVSADPQRAGDIMVAAMGILAQLPGPDPARTYTASELLAGPVLPQVQVRYSEQDQFMVGEPYHALVGVQELQQLLCNDRQDTGQQPLRDWCQRDPSPAAIAQLDNVQLAPILITVFKDTGPEISEGADLIMAAHHQHRADLPVLFMFPENGVITEASLAQAAILAGADPTVVTQATAAGRLAAPGTPRPAADFTGAGGVASPS